MSENVQKVQISQSYFFCTFKRAIAQSLLPKEQLRENLQKKIQISLAHFFHFLKRVIAHFQNGRFLNCACWAICTFKKPNFLFAVLKSAIVQLHFLVDLFKIEIVRSHFCLHFSNVRQNV
ncbi:MAG: hypothetical protein FJ333_04305 [Sphingomonadales bacterium]|nr:hypothetical protein [Sphingomonadales bacterium]